MRALVLLLLLAAAPPAEACRLALAHVIDKTEGRESASYRLQRDGFVAAMRDETVRAAILDGDGPVGIVVIERIANGRENLDRDWVMLETPEDIDALIASVESDVRTRYALDPMEASSLGVMLYGAHASVTNRPDCALRTIDIAGDEIDHANLAPPNPYLSLDFSGITVNALVVHPDPPPELLAWFAQNVRYGEGAFVETVAEGGDVVRAIRRKLLRELKSQTVVAANEAEGG